MFNGSSALIGNVNDNPKSVHQLQKANINHPNKKDIAKKISLIGFFVAKDNLISLNLWDHYSNIILDSNDRNPGEGLSLNKFYLIYGVGGLNGIGNEENDGLVTVNDQLAIANGVKSSNNNKTIQYKQSHGDLPNDNSIKEKIKEVLGG